MAIEIVRRKVVDHAIDLKDTHADLPVTMGIIMANQMIKDKVPGVLEGFHPKSGAYHMFSDTRSRRQNGLNQLAALYYEQYDIGQKKSDLKMTIKEHAKNVLGISDDLDTSSDESESEDLQLTTVNSTVKAFKKQEKKREQKQQLKEQKYKVNVINKINEEELKVSLDVEMESSDEKTSNIIKEYKKLFDQGCERFNKSNTGLSKHFDSINEAGHYSAFFQTFPLGAQGVYILFGNPHMSFDYSILYIFNLYPSKSSRKTEKVIRLLDLRPEQLTEKAFPENLTISHDYQKKLDELGISLEIEFQEEKDFLKRSTIQMTYRKDDIQVDDSIKINTLTPQKKLIKIYWQR